METQAEKGGWRRYGHVRNETAIWLSWTVSIATDHIICEWILYQTCVDLILEMKSYQMLSWGPGGSCTNAVYHGTLGVPCISWSGTDVPSFLRMTLS